MVAQEVAQALEAQKAARQVETQEAAQALVAQKAVQQVETLRAAQQPQQEVFLLW